LFRVGIDQVTIDSIQGSGTWTDYVRQAMDMEKEGLTREIWLPEKLDIEKDDLKQTPKAILRSILEIMRNATGKANYGTSMKYEGKGRFYAKGDSVATTGKCPKMARYILLKKEHYGADIQGCHFSIAISFLNQEEKTLPPYYGAREAKEYIGQQFGEREDKKEVIKTVLKLLISGTVNGIRETLKRQHDIDIPEVIDNFIKDFIDKKRRIVEMRMYQRFGTWIARDHNNLIARLYRLCEAVEARIMLGTLEGLLERGITSVVWLHDGLYIHNKVHFDEVEQRIQEQAGKLGAQVIVRKENLEEELDKERINYRRTHGTSTEDGTAEKRGIDNVMREGKEECHKEHEVVDLGRPYRDPPKRMGKKW